MIGIGKLLGRSETVKLDDASSISGSINNNTRGENTDGSDGAGSEDELEDPEKRKRDKTLFKLPTILRGKRSGGGVVGGANTIAITEKEIKAFRELRFNFNDKKRLLDIWQEMVQTSTSTAEVSNSGSGFGGGFATQKLTYRKFLAYFRFTNENWVKRTFDILNISLSGAATLFEFLVFCRTYLVVDIAGTEEFSFRLMSRRGSTFNAKYSVLDVTDIENFVSLRYLEIKKPPVLRKRALEVFTTVDKDGDGGLDIEEFHKFSAENASFLRVSHPIQNHLRKCILGIDFWVHKSRKIKFGQATAVEAALSSAAKINAEAERFATKHIKDPVSDKLGTPLVVPPYRPPELEEGSQQLLEENLRPAVHRQTAAGKLTTSKDAIGNETNVLILRNGGEGGRGEGSASDLDSLLSKLGSPREHGNEGSRGEGGGEGGGGGSIVSSNNDKDKEKRPMSRGGISRPNSRPISRANSRPHLLAKDKDKEQSRDSAGFRRSHTPDTGKKGALPTSGLLSARGKSGAVFGGGKGGAAGIGEDNVEAGTYNRDPSELISPGDTREFISWRGPFTHSESIPRRKFDLDFPQIAREKAERKLRRRLQQQEALQLAESLTARNYDKLVIACSDLIYSRRGLRKAFLKWLLEVGMVSKAVVHSPAGKTGIQKSPYQINVEQAGKYASKMPTEEGQIDWADSPPSSDLEQKYQRLSSRQQRGIGIIGIGGGEEEDVGYYEAMASDKQLPNTHSLSFSRSESCKSNRSNKSVKSVHSTGLEDTVSVLSDETGGGGDTKVRDTQQRKQQQQQHQRNQKKRGVLSNITAETGTGDEPGLFRAENLVRIADLPGEEREKDGEEDGEGEDDDDDDDDDEESIQFGDPVVLLTAAAAGNAAAESVGSPQSTLGEDESTISGDGRRKTNRKILIAPRIKRVKSTNSLQSSTSISGSAAGASIVSDLMPLSIHERIVATNERMHQQAESSAVDDYLHEYLEEHNTKDWDVHRLYKLRAFKKEIDAAQYR